MAGRTACRLSLLSQAMLISMALFVLTGLHSAAAHAWDPDSSSSRRSHHNAANSQSSNYSKNLPNHNINHGRTSRSSSYYNGGAGQSHNDLVRMGAAKPADWYETGKNRYMYEHVQSGSITLPKGGRAFLEPDQNRTLAYAHHAPHTTVYRQKPAHMHQRNRNHHHQRHTDWPSSRRSSDPSVKTTIVNGLCIKCPADKTAIARKGLDGVLIELPMLTTCRNQPISRDLYELETLFGAKFNFILPHSNGGGPFSFLARVVNKRSGKIVQTCDLRYKVIVKQCGRYYPKNKDLKVTCDLGNIWGSKCTFHCKNDGYLSNQDAFVECGEEQSWEGVEPYCDYNDISDDYAYDSDSIPTSECSYLIPPNNGRFACEMKPTAESSNDLYVPNGTICRIKCNDNHEIPAHLQAGSVFGCHEGRWNSTMKHFCHKAGPRVHRKRRYG